MAKYASETSVPISRSRAEIEDVLSRYGAESFAYADVFSRYGAESFAYATVSDKAMIAFTMRGRQARIIIPLPKIEDFNYTETGRQRTESSRYAEWEQASRQIWRVMLIMIKAKLEAIELEATTFEHEFMADTVLPSGQTVAEFMIPQVTEAYKTGNMPPLLLLAGIR